MIDGGLSSLDLALVHLGVRATDDQRSRMAPGPPGHEDGGWLATGQY